MPWPMAPMGPPPARPHVAVARLRRPAAQLQRARDAPPRPELADCDACEKCRGGRCERWRQLQRQWVEAWGGRPPPDEGNWGNWWKGVKTHHAHILAAAEAPAEQPEREAAPAAAGNAAGKRPAQPDGTPFKGGPRKTAVREGEGSSRVHSLLLPPSQGQSAEEAEIAEVLAVMDVADAAEAAAAAEAAEVAEVAEVAEAAEAAEAAKAAKAALAALVAQADEEFGPEPRIGEVSGFSEAQARAKVETDDPDIQLRAAEYDAYAPELAGMFLGEDPTLSALARDWAQYFSSDCDYELRAILAGAALEHKRRNLKVCKPWLDDLSVL